MKIIKIFNIAVLMLISLALTQCKFEEVTDPNRPDIQGIILDPNISYLNNLITGIESEMRKGYASYVFSTGSVAREGYLFDADPRNTDDLLGKDSEKLDNNTYYITGPFAAKYRVVKQCNILLEALDNNISLTDEEKNGYRGFANTIKAHELHIVLNMLNDNGIRVEVSDPESLGPFVSKAEGYSEIMALLDLGATQLNSAGDEFVFSLNDGYNGFNTPSSFLYFNRALATRMAVYQEDWTSALNLINDSFFELNGDLSTGPKQIFSTFGADILNPIYRAPGNSGDMFFAHASWVEDAEPGDLRVANKVAEADQVKVQDGLEGRYETRRYASNVAPVDIIRNEELVLLYAEINIQLNQLNDAITALNVIRTAAGLNPTNAQTKEELIDEMLMQRNYSLWQEGHRMVDMRRYGRLNDQYLPIDRQGDIIHMEFPIPLTEAVN